MSVVGVLVLTRLLGPANYGLYISAYVVLIFLEDIGSLGVAMYLVRRPESSGAAEGRIYDQAFTLLVLLACLSMAGAWFCLPILHLWFGNPNFIPPLQAMIPTLLVSFLRITEVARLERRLDYRAVTLIDLAGQMSYLLVALILALMSAGVWSLVAGYWMWQVVALTVAYWVTRTRPRLYWSTALVKDMLRYGIGYQASHWVWTLRPLVSPLVVGRYLGPEGVGYVALAVRFVETLGFMKGVTYRLSIAVLAKLQGDYARLSRAMEEAISLQVLTVGPLLGGFAAVAGAILPIVFDSDWAPTLQVFPFIALGYMVNAMFNMHSSVLYVLQRARYVGLFSLVHITLLASASVILVPWLGLWGFGVAEIVALPSYAVVHYSVQSLFSFSYKTALPWLVVFSLPLFGTLIPFPWQALLWIPAGALMLWPQRRQQIGGYLAHLPWRSA